MIFKVASNTKHSMILWLLHFKNLISLFYYVGLQHVVNIWTSDQCLVAKIQEEIFILLIVIWILTEKGLFLFIIYSTDFIILSIA